MLEPVEPCDDDMPRLGLRLGDDLFQDAELGQSGLAVDACDTEPPPRPRAKRCVNEQEREGIGDLDPDAGLRSEYHQPRQRDDDAEIKRAPYALNWIGQNDQRHRGAKEGQDCEAAEEANPSRFERFGRVDRHEAGRRIDEAGDLHIGSAGFGGRSDQHRFAGQVDFLFGPGLRDFAEFQRRDERRIEAVIDLERLRIESVDTGNRGSQRLATFAQVLVIGEEVLPHVAEVIGRMRRSDARVLRAEAIVRFDQLPLQAIGGHFDLVDKHDPGAELVECFGEVGVDLFTGTFGQDEIDINLADTLCVEFVQCLGKFAAFPDLRRFLDLGGGSDEDDIARRLVTAEAGLDQPGKLGNRFQQEDCQHGERHRTRPKQVLQSLQRTGRARPEGQPLSGAGRGSEGGFLVHSAPYEANRIKKLSTRPDLSPGARAKLRDAMVNST